MKLLLGDLPAVEDDLTRGALVVLEDTRARIRDRALGSRSPEAVTSSRKATDAQTFWVAAAEVIVLQRPFQG